jgi:two-component system heavy metal sensor histidine kinase CusS
MHLSIRWRLTLWNTLALGLVLLGFAVLVYILMSRALYQQLDRKLLTAFRQLEQDGRASADPEGRLRHWIYEFKEHDNFFAVVYQQDGKVRARTEELAPASVPPAVSIPAPQQRFRDLAVPIVGRQRILESGLRLGGQDLTILVMASLEDVDREREHLLGALLVAVPVALGLCGGVGYVLARKALAPVDQLRRRTEEITADRLDRRLPVSHTGDELGALAATINDMIGRLERSFAEVRRFTADASHELRTPLTAIRAEAEVALGRAQTPEQRHLLGSILEECERLTRLTDQLLALSRDEAGLSRGARETVDLAALTRAVGETIRPVAEAKGLRLEIAADVQVRVRGDEARFRQVLYNLLDNAIKYTPEGGLVELRAVQQGSTAIVTVRDSGVGIAADHLPRVFDRFYRVDKSRSRQEGGSGLGLSIAQSIVQAHGGRIELTSTPGRGTVCTVTLPVEAGQGNEAATGSQPS